MREMRRRPMRCRYSCRAGCLALICTRCKEDRCAAGTAIEAGEGCEAPRNGAELAEQAEAAPMSHPIEGLPGKTAPLLHLFAASSCQRVSV